MDKTREKLAKENEMDTHVIEPHRIYDSATAGATIGVSRSKIVKFVKEKRLKAMPLGQGGGFKILGINLLRFMEENE